ncbi:MAG TPA: ATP-binding cassette domain-containing protein [Bacteroidales bacterium]|nr:ATP-binding cassette domain-containing protein [Bacteroidales bacterium]
MGFLVTEGVSKQYSNHRALDKVSISVKERCIYGLLGPNGAGKTSLIRIINQITAPDEGRVLLKGRQLQPSDTAIIGYLPEERGLYKKMKVGEQALYLAKLKGLDNAKAKKKLKEWFERFEIQDWWNRTVEELSKGMQQKVQFIVTVIHEPELLIFDEPFSGFDPINANLLKEEIFRLRNQGATILFSTHNMASVEELCDDIALINRSKKILEGKVAEIKRKFREHLFELEIGETNGSVEQLMPAGYDIVEKTTLTTGQTRVKVKNPLAENGNALLSNVMKHTTVFAFREILPSMNDIFIQQVQGVDGNNGNNLL